MTSNAVLLFHLGWTDIINCLPLISYFQSRYRILYVLYKSQTRELFENYCSQYENIGLLEMPNRLDDEERIVPLLLNFLKESTQLNIQDLHLHGFHDKYREDIYKNAFSRKSDEYFSTRFYTAYDIPYQVRVDSFSLPRSVEREKTLLESLVVPGEEYMLVHDSEECKIDLSGRKEKIIQLHGVSTVFFDAVLLLQNAKEIHVIDSVWAAVCYSIDAKYRFLQSIPVHVYCFRGHEDMFTKPIRLKNWVVKNIT